MDKEKSKPTIYKILPEEITEDFPESEPNYSTSHFINDALPIADSLNVATALSKATIGIDRQIEISKKVKPCGKKSGLSQKERRMRGLYRLPKCSISYAEALPMLRLWEDYLFRFLNLHSMRNKPWYDPKSGHLRGNMNIALMKADYHGALLKVVKSKCNSLVNLQGIVVFDTKYTFTIVCKDNMSRTLPKQSCIFELYLKNYKFKIFGKHFCIRSSERSTKRMKSHLIPIL